jgi:23S rRNA (pseudouridine1915-N3)-methyltransferase
MRIVLICVGRLKLGPEKDLFDRYCHRLIAIGRQCGIHGLDVREIEESRARRPQDRRGEEWRSIENVLPKGGVCCIWDERGQTLNSDQFATNLVKIRDSESPVAFVVGGPDGLSEHGRTIADQLISFGAMTLPHQLVRILVVEQLYRAATLLTGHPYHRG